MSKIRLNGTTSGYTEIAPPAVAGDNTVTLPSSNGSANQFLKNGSTAGTLGWSSMVETASGVGIGTASPTTKLHVQQTSDGEIFRIQRTGGSNIPILAFDLSESANTATFRGTGATGCAIAFNTGATERARITSGGDFLVNTTNLDPAGSNVIGCAIGPSSYISITRDGGVAGAFNRKTNDGEIFTFRQDGTQEGSISVSGTTVSYNGAHLSRWSQIPGIDPHDKDARPEILRGTVMSNLDEMCDWIDPDSGEAQANEQLNKTKISDVEGDKNVAGVFQSWDDDDDTWVNDFYLAMTGDFVIRIAEGVTVERGDLLVSAGDGTAKPQADDLIRSSTIAKITSTTVSHVHPDGSFCVPCVLMAC